MITVIVEIEVHDDGDPNEIAREIRGNLRDCIGHCPYDASIVACYGQYEEDDDNYDDDDDDYDRLDEDKNDDDEDYEDGDDEDDICY